MERFNKSAGSAGAPVAPAAPANKYFTEGNPGGGIPATIPGEWWFHMMTEELRAVIVAGGLTPDHTVLTQIRDAIAAITTARFTGSNQSLTTSGYQKLPGGLIFQWGTGSYAAATASFTFPIAFPSACASITITRNDPVQTNASVHITTKSAAGFSIYDQDVSSNTILYIAIGY